MCTYRIVAFGCGCVKKAGEVAWCVWAAACERECADFQQTEGAKAAVYANCIQCNARGRW